MLTKTSEGKSRTGGKFKGYSKAYKDSPAFKAAGKGNKVNLTLTGDMLGLLEIVGESANTITLGWEESDEAGKAHGHITGGNKLPVRDFFGINATDLSEIKKNFKVELEEIAETSGDSREEAIGSFIRRLEEDGQS